MSVLVALLAQLLHIGLMLAVAPLVVGLIRKVKARLLGRIGPPILQPWRDLARLARKQPVLAENASWVFSGAPAVTFAATLAASLSHTYMRGDHSFAYIPARDAGVSPQNGFGGAYIAYDFAGVKGTANYDNTLVPHAVVSPWLTYTGEGWGAALGATYVGTARQTVPNPITYPAHVTANASAFIARDGWRLALNLDNAFDARFFTPDADTYANLGALPGMGRRWRIALMRSF
jgi:hypothetical protein